MLYGTQPRRSNTPHQLLEDENAPYHGDLEGRGFQELCGLAVIPKTPLSQGPLRWTSPLPGASASDSSGYSHQNHHEGFFLDYNGAVVYPPATVTRTPTQDVCRITYPVDGICYLSRPKNSPPPPPPPATRLHIIIMI